MTTRKLVCWMASVGLIAGCADHTQDGSALRYFSIGDGIVAVHSNTRADAMISAGGTLTIAGRHIAIAPPQQELLKHYYATVISLREHSIATGMAGAATGGQAIASVFSGLLSGNPDKIGPQIDARAGKVEAEVTKLCADLGEIRTTQDLLAGQLPDFQPYAVIDARTVAHCN